MVKRGDQPVRGNGQLGRNLRSMDNAEIGANTQTTRSPVHDEDAVVGECALGYGVGAVE